MRFFQPIEMTEDEFTDKFIDAVFAKDQREMSRLCDLAGIIFGEKLASSLASNCYESVKLADPALGKWLNSWFTIPQHDDR